MKYYKTYTVTAVFFLIAFTGFLCKVLFWPEPQDADAMQMGSPVSQKADAKPTSNDDNRLVRYEFYRN